MDVILYGAGLLGRQVQHFVRSAFAEQLRVMGFIDDGRPTGQTVVDELTILGGLDQVCAERRFAPPEVRLILAIGYADMQARRRAFERAKRRGYQFQSVVHPAAHVESDAQLGEGVVILPGAVLDQRAVLGDMNFVDIGSLISENCVIGANNFIAAGTTIGGNTRIGDDNFIGLDTTVVNDVTIGSDNTINAKTLIYKNLGDHHKVIEFHEQHIQHKDETWTGQT